MNNPVDAVPSGFQLFAPGNAMRSEAEVTAILLEQILELKQEVQDCAFGEVETSCRDECWYAMATVTFGQGPSLWIVSNGDKTAIFLPNRGMAHIIRRGKGTWFVDMLVQNDCSAADMAPLLSIAYADHYAPPKDAEPGPVQDLSI